MCSVLTQWLWEGGRWAMGTRSAVDTAFVWPGRASRRPSSAPPTRPVSKPMLTVTHHSEHEDDPPETRGMVSRESTCEGSQSPGGGEEVRSFPHRTRAVRPWSAGTSRKREGFGVVGKLSDSEAAAVTTRDYEVLAEMVSPSPEFVSSALPTGASMEYIDLRWLCPSRRTFLHHRVKKSFRKAHVAPRFTAVPPEVRHTLLNLPTDYTATIRDPPIRGRWRPLSPSKRRPALINSPRSALTLLRLGLSVADLQEKPLTDFARSDRNPHEQHRMWEAYERGRRCRLARCRSVYTLMCEEVGFEDVVEFFEEHWRRRLGPQEVVVDPSLTAVSPPRTALSSAARHHLHTHAGRIQGWGKVAYPASQRYMSRLAVMLERQQREADSKRLKLMRSDATRKVRKTTRDVAFAAAWGMRREATDHHRMAWRETANSINGRDTLARAKMLVRSQNVEDLRQRAAKARSGAAQAATVHHTTQKDFLSSTHQRLDESAAASMRCLMEQARTLPPEKMHLPVTSLRPLEASAL
eukprot:Sspe_Gene.90116::Locus_61741_Transcript_2_2_Confidence_0.500_Length_1840::g.90116::m.90116